MNETALSNRTETKIASAAKKLPASACFFGILLLYFSGQVWLRVHGPQTLEKDEAEQVFLAQWLHGGYNTQPPFYNWVQQFVFMFTGPTILGLAVVKNAMLMATFGVVYFTARRVMPTTAMAIAASLGMFLIPQIAWECQRDLAHTVAATFAGALLLYSVVWTLQTGRTLAYLVCGLAVGIGILSKYNTVVLMFAVMAAALSLKEHRSIVASPKLLGTIAIAILVASPHLLWLVQHPALASGGTLEKMSADATSSYIVDTFVGLVAVARGTLMFWVVPAVLFTAVFGMRFVRCTAVDAPPARFFNRVLLFGMGLLLLIALSGNATNFRARWLQPFLFCLPMIAILKMNLDRELDAAKVRLFSRVCVGAMVIMLVAISIRSSWYAPQVGGVAMVNGMIDGYAGVEARSVEELDYESIVDDWLADAKTRPKLIVADNMIVAGNLRLRMPDTPVLSLLHPHLTAGATQSSDSISAASRWVFVWSDGEPDETGKRVRQAGERFGLQPVLVGHRSEPVAPVSTHAEPEPPGTVDRRLRYAWGPPATLTSPSAVIANRSTSRWNPETNWSGSGQGKKRTNAASLK